jgi:glucose/arabinose dehydrogenase
VLSTWNGDVWQVSGIDDDLAELTWRRIATGLHDPLGLKVVDGVIHTLGRDGITRLHDLNGDGEIDWHEAFNHDVLVTRNFHEFAFDLQTDADGNFYFSKAGPVRPGGRGFDEIAAHHGTILVVSPDGERLEVYATGLRAPNGIGVSPAGVVTSGDNQGTWMPACRLNWLPEPGMFTSCVDTSHSEPRPTARSSTTAAPPPRR